MAGRNEEATDLINFIAEALPGLFSSSCFTRFCKVFVSGFSIASSVRFLEVNEGSSRPINRGQLGVDGDEDGQMIMASEVETDQTDNSAILFEAKLMSGKVDRPFVGSRVGSFSLRMVQSVASILSASCSPLSSLFVFVSHLE